MKENVLIAKLKEEKKDEISDGIYNKLQVDFAYNSNHMEGNKLSYDQTKYIFETKTVGIEPARVEDIIEAVNHFRCFDYVIDHIAENLTIAHIKELHRILKSGTYSADAREAVVGDFKKYPTPIGKVETSAPEDVERDMEALVLDYQKKKVHDFDEILEFHADFEKIHPFYDGNGRAGRLLMFRECLRNGFIPFIMADDYKAFYYKGLQEWQSGGEKAYLRDTCFLMQDQMKATLENFKIV